jgi:hypothetical protein
MEEREIGPETLLAETNYFQCLEHLVKQNLVSKRGEMKSIAA